MAVKQVGFQAAVDALKEYEGIKAPLAKEKPPVSDSVASSGELKPFTGKYEKFAKPCEWLQKRCPNAADYGVFFYQNDTRKSAVNGHVLIPIRDIERVNYGYLARNIGQVTQERPKYRFPTNLPKSRFLFGCDVLKGGKFGQVPLRVCYLVESPWTCMKFASLGLPAVSPFGWSVSEEQVKMVSALSKGVIYLPDRNKQQDCQTVVAVLAQSLWLRFPPLPTGCDDPEQLPNRESILALTSG